MSYQADTLQIVFGLTVVGSGIMANGFQQFRMRRLIQDLPTSNIGSAAQGLVELQGRAYPLAGRTVASVGKSKLVVNEIEVQSYPENDDDDRWVTEYKGVFGDRFVVQDATGCAHVLIRDAELNLEETIYDWDAFTPDSQFQIEKEILPALKGRGIFNFSKNSIGPGQWRIIERSLAVGEEVYLVGAFQTRSNEPPVNIEDGKGAVTRVTPAGGVMKRSPHPMLIADCKQSDLLNRIGSLSLIKTIAGSALIAVAAFLCIAKYL